MKTRAFTLIELLVVVLIIGILAAIAVPQYQKAVRKSQAAEAVVNIKALKRAQEAYWLANGKYTTNIDNLDLTFNTNVYTYKCIKDRYIDCYALRADGKTPAFEQVANILFCRGTEKDCDAWPIEYYTDSYWIIKE